MCVCVCVPVFHIFSNSCVIAGVLFHVGVWVFSSCCKFLHIIVLCCFLTSPKRETFSSIYLNKLGISKFLEWFKYTTKKGMSLWEVLNCGTLDAGRFWLLLHDWKRTIMTLSVVRDHLGIEFSWYLLHEWFLDKECYLTWIFYIVIWYICWQNDCIEWEIEKDTVQNCSAELTKCQFLIVSYFPSSLSCCNHGFMVAICPIFLSS